MSRDPLITILTEHACGVTYGKAGCIGLYVIGSVYMVIGCESSKIGCHNSTSLIAVVLATVGARPVFNDSFRDTGCINLCVMYLVLMSDCGDLVVSRDPLFTVFTEGTGGVTNTYAGFIGLSVIDGIYMVIRLDRYYNFGYFVSTCLIAVILVTVGAEPVLDRSCFGAICIDLCVMYLVLMSDCGDSFVSLDPLFTVFTEGAGGVTNTYAGFICLFVIYGIYVVLGIERNHKIGCNFGTSLIAVVLVTVGAEPVFDGSRSNTSCIDLCVMYLVLMTDCGYLFVSRNPLITIFTEGTGCVTHAYAGFIGLYVIGGGCVVIGIDRNYKIRYLCCTINIAVVHVTVRAGPVFDGSFRDTGCIDLCVMYLVLVSNCGDILHIKGLRCCPNCGKVCSVGGPTLLGTGCRSFNGAACRYLFVCSVAGIVFTLSYRLTGFTVFTPNIAYDVIVIKLKYICYQLCLGFCPRFLKGCGVESCTVLGTGCGSLHHTAYNCSGSISMICIVSAYAGCGASRSVSCKIVGYCPIMVKSIYVFYLQCLSLCPILGKCCGIGGLTLCLASSGSGYIGSDSGSINCYVVFCIAAAYAGCGASRSVICKIVGYCPIMAKSIYVFYLQCLCLCPIFGKCCGISGLTLCLASSGRSSFGSDSGSINCYVVFCVASAYVSSSASRSVCRKTVGYCPIMVKSIYVFYLQCLPLCPIFGKCCSIGGLTLYLASSGSGYIGSDSCCRSFLVAVIVSAYAGCGASRSVYRKAIGYCPIVAKRSQIYSILIEIDLCFLIRAGIVSVSAIGTSDLDVAFLFTESEDLRFGVGMRTVFVNAVLKDGMITGSTVLGNILSEAATVDGELAQLNVEGCLGIISAHKIYVTACDLNLTNDGGVFDLNVRHCVCAVLTSIKCCVSVCCGDSGILDLHATAVDRKTIENVFVTFEAHVLNGQVSIVLNKNLGHLAVSICSAICGKSTVLKRYDVACKDLETESFGTGRTYGTIEGVGITAEVDGDRLVDYNTRTNSILNKKDSIVFLCCRNSFCERFVSHVTDLCNCDLL